MMVPLQPASKVSKAYWFVDRQHSFSSARCLKKLHGSGKEDDDVGVVHQKNVREVGRTKKGVVGGGRQGRSNARNKVVEWEKHRCIVICCSDWCNFPEEGQRTVRNGKREMWRQGGCGSSSKKQLLWFRTVCRAIFGMDIPGHPHPFPLNT